jgi:hypothetical protein
VAFLVETGAGLPTATSYLAVADFKTYHDDRGIDWSAYDNAQIEAALVLATDYIDVRFFYKGTRSQRRDQSLEWPRRGATDPDYNLIDSDSLPTEVTDSASDLAFLELTEGIFQTIEFDETGREVIETTDVVGPIRRTRKFKEGAGSYTSQTWKNFPNPDARLWRVSVPPATTTARA